ncbi:MAG: TolC family protein [Bdellovibrio sp.]
MTSSISCLFFFVIATTMTAKASETLSFKQGIELVKNNNSEIKAAEETLQASIYQVNSIRGLYYPQISANMTYNNSGPNRPYSTNGNYTASLNATENIFNGFSDITKVEQALAQTEISKSALQLIKAKVSFDLKSAYANILYAKETAEVAQDFVKRRQQNLSMVELRFNNGRENKGSLLLSRAYLQQALVNVLKAKNRFQTSQSDLSKTLGMTSDTNFEIGNDLPMNTPSSTEPDYEKLIFSLPNYAQARSQIRASEANLKLAQAGFYPNLNLSASAGKYADTFFPDKDQWSVGVQFTLPLFNGGRDYFFTRSASANVLASTNNLYTLEREQSSVLKKAFTAYVEAVEDLKVSEAFLTAAKSRAEIARAKYNNGLLTFDEWDIIENDLINRTQIYLTSKRDRITAEASWEQAQGIGVIP